ncbi:MAG: chemotaxis protein CheW [Gammaproteobacteria bacterium]|nr:MAG: chemotaxis protein CheW [Gammaproteobacteria bacterium]
MSSRGRKKVDEAILDYLSDLLTPPVDEQASTDAEPNSARTAEAADRTSAGSVEKKVPAAEKTPAVRSSPPRQPVEAPVVPRSMKKVPPPRPVRVADTPVIKPAPPMIALKVASAESVRKSSPVHAQQSESAPQTIDKPKTDAPATVARHPDKARTQEAATSVPPKEARTAAQPAPANKAPEGLPAWADERFQVLLFEVAGLKLAVPLISLGSIYPIEDRLTHLFGMPDWFMGLMPKGDVQIKVVDTALWVMPEKYDPAMRESARFVVTLHGTEWGLASHEIHESLTLHRDDVKWRQSRGKRPWLAGTVVQHMCALLDVEAFGQLLANSEHQHRKHTR